MVDTTIIDQRAIEDLRALNPGDNDAFLREITTIFLDDTPLRIMELDRSLAAGDMRQFARAAHSIKGSSSNLGATALRTAAEELERHARSSGFAGIDGPMARVKAEFLRTQAALNSMLGH